jgi:hypothetical protein
MYSSIKQKVIDFTFNFSKQPILFKDLLLANNLVNEGIQVAPSRLGFRLRLSRAYIAYIILVSIIAMPLAGITHGLFMNADFHASIVASIVFTAVIFILFNFFRDWLIDQVTVSLVKKAWKLHFPFFEYDEYKGKVAKLYDLAMKEEIPKKDLEKYILDNLIEEE